MKLVIIIKDLKGGVISRLAATNALFAMKKEARSTVSVLSRPTKTLGVSLIMSKILNFCLGCQEET
jgi:hypothetical protein